MSPSKKRKLVYTLGVAQLILAVLLFAAGRVILAAQQSKVYEYSNYLRKHGAGLDADSAPAHASAANICESLLEISRGTLSLALCSSILALIALYFIGRYDRESMTDRTEQFTSLDHPDGAQ